MSMENAVGTFVVFLDSSELGAGRQHARARKFVWVVLALGARWECTSGKSLRKTLFLKAGILWIWATPFPAKSIYTQIQIKL